MSSNPRRGAEAMAWLSPLLLALAGVAQAGSLVAPATEPADGLSQAQLVERWWQWADRVPPGVRPYQDPTGALCGLNQSGRVWFLAGTDGTADVTRHCTVPIGTALFFPVIAMLSSAEPGKAVSCARAVALAAANNAHLAQSDVRIDGEVVPQIVQHRIATPRCFDAYPTAPYLSNAKAYFPAASDGYWLLVHPLAPGRHTIEVHARYANPDSHLGDLEQVFEYELQVGGTGSDAAPDYI